MKYLSVLVATLFSLGVAANPCSNDQKQFCSSVEAGKGQMAKCLSDYEGQLSPACKAELKEFKLKSKKRNPCFEDLVEYCPDIPSEKSKIEICLLKNESRLSSVCSADFSKKKGKILVGNVCAQDIALTCYNEMKSEDGLLTRCLIKNQNTLSRFCKDKVDKQIKKLRESNACFDDTEKYCQGITKFVDIHPCLVKNKTKLSPSCQSIVDKEEKKIATLPCYMDLKRHCIPNLNPQAQERCLEINKEHLSNKCNQFREVQKNKVQRMVTDCESDRLKFCKDVPLEGGKVTKCLRQKKTQLSPACQKLL